MFVFFYILNVTLLLLHEIESGYEKEWEILKLPGKITGFYFFIFHKYNNYWKYIFRDWINNFRNKMIKNVMY